MTTSGRLRWATGGALVLAITAAMDAAEQPAAGGEVRVRLDRGRVTLVVAETRLAEVLAAWSRAGGTRFVGAEALGDELITLHLVEVDEAAAMRILLSAAAGYVAAARRAPGPGGSRYDRVKILAPSGRGLRLPAGPSPSSGPRFDPAAAGGLPGSALPAADLQRLLDAVAGRPAPAAPVEGAGEAPAAGADPRPGTAPFPGMTVGSGGR